MENEIELKLFFWIGTSIMLLSVLGVLIIVTLYKNKVDRLKREESERLLKISLKSEKNERKRIASDLHDGISGDLSAVQNFVTLLSREEKDFTKREVFWEIESILENTLTNIQNISYNLMPPTFESHGLVPTFKIYFERVQKLNNVIIKEYYYSDKIEISNSYSYELFRIIQELVNNIIKHGKSQFIFFSISVKNNMIVFEICDDGMSFDFNKNLKTTFGMGLKNIISRIKYIDAKLIQLPTNKGNKLQILLTSKNYVKNSNNR